MELQPPPNFDQQELERVFGLMRDQIPESIWDFISQGLGLPVPGTQTPSNRSPVWVINLSKKVRKSLLGHLDGANEENANAFEQGKFWGSVSRVNSVVKAKPGIQPPSAVALLEIFEPLVLAALAQAKACPAAEATQFFRGFAEGIENTIDDSGLPAKRHPTFMLHFVLLLCREHVQRCQSIPELYKWVTSIMPANQVGDIDNFRKMCGRIGLKLRPRGRPEENK